MPVTAVAVATTSTLVFDTSAYRGDVEVTIQNLGPNPIYVDFGEAATVAGSLEIPTDSAYTTRGLEDIYAICSVLQVSPDNTRVSVERVK
jgi:hypothetical protein